MNPVRGLIVSDFSANFLAESLAAGPAPEVAAALAPFAQVSQVLLDPTLECWREPPDFLVVWTNPTSMIPGFRRVLEEPPGDSAEIPPQVEQFTAQLARAADRVKWVFVPTWAMLGDHRGGGMLSMRSGLGVSRALLEMNLLLARHLEPRSNVFVLDSARWLARAGSAAFNSKLWYTAKVPYGAAVFDNAAADLKAAIRGLTGQARKLVIVDLDDTLWGGKVGEDGWQDLRLGGLDPIGEAFVDFQRELRILRMRGVLLAIVSKNTERIALQAIDAHPEMILRRQDFAAWRINWSPKADNIAGLLNELNLSARSTVFLDNSAYERDQVRSLLPDVLVPELPATPLRYAPVLSGLDCFDTPHLSEEDRMRTQLVKANQARNDSLMVGSSLDVWLAGIELCVEVETVDEKNLSRSVQLLNRTNQMNLTGRPCSEAELLASIRSGATVARAFRARDRFGPYGLVGVAILNLRERAGVIEEFALSCRAMAKGIEETMLYHLLAQCRGVGLRRLEATLTETGRNEPCCAFFRRVGQVTKGLWGGELFVLETTATGAPPAHVRLEGP